jgi:diacylglycerol kinase
MMSTEPVTETTSTPESESPHETPKRDVIVTPDGTELDQSILGTVLIDPKKLGRRLRKNAGRLRSVKFAIAGLIYVLVREQSIQFASVVTVVVIAVGLWLQVPVYNWVFLTLALGLVWVTECLNTAVEAAIDIAAPDPHPLAKVGKDVAATAALVSSIVFVIIVVLILLPSIIVKLNGA